MNCMHIAVYNIYYDIECNHSVYLPQAPYLPTQNFQTKKPGHQTGWTFRGGCGGGNTLSFDLTLRKGQHVSQRGRGGGWWPHLAGIGNRFQQINISGNVETCLQILCIFENWLFVNGHIFENALLCWANCCWSLMRIFHFPFWISAFFCTIDWLQFFGWKWIFLSTDKVFFWANVWHLFNQMFFGSSSLVKYDENQTPLEIFVLKGMILSGASYGLWRGRYLVWHLARFGWQHSVPCLRKKPQNTHKHPRWAQLVYLVKAFFFKVS